jgi:hypothetical protein
MTYRSLATSKLPAVLPGETFDAFLGVDNGVRVERKLLNRLTEVSGLFSKTRKVNYDILIVAENRKKTSAVLSIQENVPISQDDRVKVTIAAPKAGGRPPRCERHHHLEGAACAAREEGNQGAVLLGSTCRNECRRDGIIGHFLAPLSGTIPS